jgi:tRNA (cmo5U34)-methyltransferase
MSQANWNLFRYFDPVDIDKPSDLYDQLRCLETVGFEKIDVRWIKTGHAIFSGWKPTR